MALNSTISKLAQVAERFMWVFILAFIGAMTAPDVASVIVGADFSIDATEAGWIAGVTAVIKELLAWGQRRIAVLPNPSDTPTPITAKIQEQQR